jgi:hypothetical protein
MIYPLTSVHARYKEFQKTMWADVQRTPPKLILEVKNIEFSFLRDDDADLEILRNLTDDIARHYTLERRVPVGAAGASPADDSPAVYVYRRNP